MKGYAEHRCRGRLASGRQCPNRSTEVARLGEWKCPEHAECPIDVGDYVRWEHGANGENWAEGVVIDVSRQEVKLDLKVSSPHRIAKRLDIDRGSVDHGSFGHNNLTGSTIRRIPRPDEAQATVVRAPVGDIPIRITPTVHPAVKEAGRYTEPPAPALVDGLTPVQCWLRWCDNRDTVDRHLAPVHSMTAAQIAAAKVEHANGSGMYSAALRAKVDASREAWRNRVRVDVQDVD